MSVKKGRHCAYDVHYHIVFPVKYRKALIRPEIEAELVRISGEISVRYDIEFEQMGADRDHIHLLCSAHPKRGPGEIVRLFKSITARELFRTFPELKKELWGGEFWSDGYYSDGYYVATVGQRNTWETVAKYVKSQGQRSSDSPREELRRFAPLSLPGL